MTENNVELSSGADAIQLFYAPRTRSVRARWMLEELSLPYTLSLVDLSKGAHKSADHLAIHPLGKVPALEIDGTIIFESLAICLYLADRSWQDGLAPCPDDKILRAQYYKWMAFSMGTLEPAVIEQSRRKKAYQQNIEVVDMGPSLTPFETAALHVEKNLENRKFLLRDKFTASDLMNGSVMMWADGVGLLDKFKHTKNWVDRLKQRPGYQRANLS